MADFEQYPQCRGFVAVLHWVLTPQNGSIDWKGSCFLDNSARVELTAAGDRGIGGAVIYLSTGAAHSWTCVDLYVFATPYRVTWDYYFAAREHTFRINFVRQPKISTQLAIFL